MAVFMFRMVNGKVTGNSHNFKDVSSNVYYAEAVQWVAENKITQGLGDGTIFAPDDVCNRDQAVTFLHRYLEKYNVTFSK